MVVAPQRLEAATAQKPDLTQNILLTFIPTSRRQNRPVLPLLKLLICSPQPVAIDLLAPKTISRLANTLRF